MPSPQRSAAGLSLVEVTIMLLVLMGLTSVLAPSIMDFVRDAAGLVTISSGSG